MTDERRKVLAGAINHLLHAHLNTTIESCLNELVAVDADAISAIMEHRVTCKPEVETGTFAVPYSENGNLLLGALGIINGLVLQLTRSRLFAHYDDTGKKILKFSIRKEPDNGGTAVQSGHGPELREAAAGTPASGQG